MPIYRRYVVEAEITVKVHSLEEFDNKTVAYFIVVGESFADSNKNPIGENIMTAISRATKQATSFAQVVENNEKQGLRG